MNYQQSLTELTNAILENQRQKIALETEEQQLIEKVGQLNLQEPISTQQRYENQLQLFESFLVSITDEQLKEQVLNNIAQTKRSIENLPQYEQLMQKLALNRQKYTQLRQHDHLNMQKQNQLLTSFNQSNQRIDIVNLEQIQSPFEIENVQSIIMSLSKDFQINFNQLELVLTPASLTSVDPNDILLKAWARRCIQQKKIINSQIVNQILIQRQIEVQNLFQVEELLEELEQGGLRRTSSSWFEKQIQILGQFGISVKI